jgi:hypothetical protein
VLGARSVSTRRQIPVSGRRNRRLGAPPLARPADARHLSRQVADGARGSSSPVKEIGWGSAEPTKAGAVSNLDPLADEAARVLHWHGDTLGLPSEAIRLTVNANHQNQAFTVGEQALAMQFHIEADPARLDLWLVGMPRNSPSPGFRLRNYGLRHASRGQGNDPGVADFCGLAAPYRAPRQRIARC